MWTRLGGGKPVKAISLWQPYASAIALGYKKIETRHWSTKYRGPIAIHAAKRKVEHGFVSKERDAGRLCIELPFGYVVAVARLFDVWPIEVCSMFVDPLERSYGDYNPGRYGWLLVDIRPLRDPIPFKGGQGFFNVPDSVITHA